MWLISPVELLHVSWNIENEEISTTAPATHHDYPHMIKRRVFRSIKETGGQRQARGKKSQGLRPMAASWRRRTHPLQLWKARYWGIIIKLGKRQERKTKHVPIHKSAPQLSSRPLRSSSKLRIATRVTHPSRQGVLPSCTYGRGEGRATRLARRSPPLPPPPPPHKPSVKPHARRAGAGIRAKQGAAQYYPVKIAS